MIKTCIYIIIYMYYSPISEDMLDICHTCHTVQILFPSEDVSDLAPCCDNPCPKFCEKQRTVWHRHPNDSVPSLRQETKKHWRNQILSPNLNIFDLDLAQHWETSLDNPWTHNRLWHRATVHFLRLQSLPLGRNGCYTPAWIYGNPKKDRRVTSGIIQLKSC